MGDDGVSDISAGAGEGVGCMVNGAGLASGSIARSGASGGGSTVGVETRIDNELDLPHSPPSQLLHQLPH